MMASKRGAYTLRNKDDCWGSGVYCTLYARKSFWHCSSCGVKTYINKSSRECAVCQFQRVESEYPGWGCQCTNTSDGGNRQLILETRAAQWRANITQNFAGNYIGLPQTVSGPIRAAWDQQEAELWAQQRPATDQSSAAQPAQPPQPQLLKAGKLHLLSTGEWYVHCKWCETETRLEARNEEEAYGMLGGWQLSMPQLPRSHLRRNWSCPKCVDEYWNERDQLKAEVVQLKAEVEWLKAAFVELKCADTKQTTDARPGPTIVVAFTEDEAKEMRDIAEETGRCGQSLVHLSIDICGPCNPWSPTSIADDMERDGNRIVTLSSRLLQLLREQSSASSREV